MKHVLLCAVLVAPVFASPALWAEDVWETGNNGVFTRDDSPLTTENELAPGSSQVHDLQAYFFATVPDAARPDGSGFMVADQDWYRISQKPYSSYEVVVDGTTAGMGVVPVTNPGDELALDLMTNATTVAAPSGGLGASGAARVLYFRNETGAAIDNQQIRVSSPECDTACGANQQYTIHFLDTTYSVPRFNNSATQVTLLIIQNTSFRPVFSNVIFFSSAGTPLTRSTTNIPARGSLVLNTSTVPGLSGASGSIIVLNDGRYGALAGKAVSLEPATGFTFDTALVPRAQ